MTRTRALTFLIAGAVSALTLIAPAAALAQPQPPKAPAPAAAPAPPQAPAVVDSRDAGETREALMEVLRQYPPSLGPMLATDPGLMSNTQFMTAYPSLAQFLQQHPEVARNPMYYFQSYRSGSSNYFSNSEEGRAQQAINAWRNIIEGFTFLLGFLSVVAGITWIIRSIIDHRRWSRLSKVQAEVHNKLIDRLASNDEMLAYIQSPAGGEFLKVGPSAVGASAAKAMHAPFGRILWSAQAGVIGHALGLGFIASSGLSYLLSRRMGLIEPKSGERETPSRS